MMNAGLEWGIFMMIMVLPCFCALLYVLLHNDEDK